MAPHPKHAHHLHKAGKHHPAGRHPAGHHTRRSPRVTVVDTEDNVIAHKHWDALKPGDIHRASFLWITNSKGQVLLSKRSRHVHNPGRWTAAVSGTVMEDETYEDNIRKEAEEEIGLTGISFNTGPKILVKLPDESIWIQWFVLMLDRESHGFKPAKSEVEELRWMDRDRFQAHADAHPELYTPSVALWKHLWA